MATTIETTQQTAKTLGTVGTFAAIAVVGLVLRKKLKTKGKRGGRSVARAGRRASPRRRICRKKNGQIKRCPVRRRS
jgi:hypothetical protein